VTLREVRAKSLLRKGSRVDSWFLAGCGMNLYRGCAHNCAYCDGRAEKYAVEGEFGREVAVKVNAPELLRRELAPRRGRTVAPNGYILLGGGVGDSYQPAEERYRLARVVLELLLELGRPVHVLTKSTLVERDLDLLQSIHARARVIVSMSFSCVDDELAARFEPGVPAPSERLRLLERCRRAGLPTGMFLMPVLPYLTDTEEALQRTIRAAAAAGVGFIVFGGLTLKPGRQKEHFLEVLAGYRPELAERYRRLYPERGQAPGRYDREILRRFAAIAAEARIPTRIPPELYEGLLSPAQRALVVLEHLHYLLELRGQASPYGGAARALEARPELAEPGQLDLFPANGLSPEAMEVLEELRHTGRAAIAGSASLHRTLLERLLRREGPQ
jgi:DNA repair photolyase